MYSDVKSVQILLALLKAYHIRYAVTSPGGCSIPIIRSLENDSFFKCYSVVDERSEAYFALGLAQTVKEPVAVICTSGTAGCNLLSGVTEAFYQRVPLIVITADRHPYFYGQLETQKIYQDDLFRHVVKKAVSLPVVKDDFDAWYCARLVNEALLEFNHHGTGPVHINIPANILPGINSSSYNTTELPSIPMMKRVEASCNAEEWSKLGLRLKDASRILVVFGQSLPPSQVLISKVEAFFKRFNCSLSVDHLSNFSCEGTINTNTITEISSLKAFDKLLPDIVISLGNYMAGEQLKKKFAANSHGIEHWLIDEAGAVKDVFHCLSIIFEMPPELFFTAITEHCPAGGQNDLCYHNLWVDAIKRVQVPQLPFSNMLVAQKLAAKLPAGVLLHTGILNSTRHMQLFELAPDIEVFSNVGALGIDGCLSSFIGQAAGTDRPAFILMGDLSFFDDMNALRLPYISKNVRIIMVNNHGAGEFHRLMPLESYQKVNELIAVEHNTNAKGWVESVGFAYFAASNEIELAAAIDQLIAGCDRPMFLEVFTQKEVDADNLKNVYADNFQYSSDEELKRQLRGAIVNVIGEKTTQKIVSAVKSIIR